METNRYLVEKLVYKVKIELLTGLHIGGSNTAMAIGGPDNFVVRNPLTNLPYIPGSSLKGKLRALYEIKNREIHIQGNKASASETTNTKSGRLYGTSASSPTSRPSRLIVRDAPMSPESKIALENVKTDLPYAESKTEVTIDRITAIANPRTFERVPAGVVFDGEMVVNIFSGESKEELLKTLKESVELLHQDYLGGHGSRGYGQVRLTFTPEL